MPVFDLSTNAFPMLTPQQTSPFGGVLADAISKRLAMAQAQKAETEAKYSERSTLANVINQELQNRWNPKRWQSEIGLQGSETSKNKLLVNNPGLLGGDVSKEIAALKLMGYDVSGIGQQPAQATEYNPGITIPQIPKTTLNASQTNDLKSQIMQTMSNQPNVQGLKETPNVPEIPSIGQYLQQQQQVPGQTQAGFSPIQTGNSLVDRLLNRKFANSAYQQQMLQGYNWAHLPGDAKDQLIAQGLGMGISPMKMMKYVNDGYDLPQIAQTEGLDPNNLPPPIYNPTKGTLTRVQQVEQVGHELDYLSSAVTPDISQYADTFAGVSPERISDMLSGDPEAQKRFGRYIGALSVQSGLANGRILLEGGRPGVEVMKMVKDGALKGIDQNSPIKMSKIAYEEAQKYIDEKLQKGAKIRTTTGMNPFSEIGKAHANETNESNLKPVDQMSNEELLAEAKQKRWI